MQLTQGLHRAVQTSAGATATIFGARRRTFAEQADRVARLAGGLRQLGVSTGDRVAIMSLNSDRYVEYLLAVPWSGAVLNPLNIRWSPTEIAFALDDSASCAVFVDDTFADMIDIIRSSCPDLKWVIFCGEGPTPAGMIGYEDIIRSHHPMPDARRGGADLAGLFYTGGTTGFPKGVMLSHRNLLCSALGTIATGQLLTEGSVLLHAAPMFHLADLAGWAGQSLMGGAHVMVPAFRSDAVFAAIQQHRVTDVVLVPTMIQMLIADRGLHDFDLSSLQRILYGGSTIAEGLLAHVMELLPGVKLTQAYGMTEASPVATLLWPRDHHGARLSSAGRAAPHAEVQVVDEAGTALPSGQVGEICVRGDHIMAGYWGRDRETAEVLVDGWYRTGDAGYIDSEGFLFVVDRIKDMIVTGGENVYSAEVENALSTHPAIATSAVIGIPSAQWGEAVHAVVVLRAGRTADEEQLRQHVKQRLANYKVPRGIDFVDELPLSGAGKVLKRKLREQVCARTTSVSVSAD